MKEGNGKLEVRRGKLGGEAVKYYVKKQGDFQLKIALFYQVFGCFFKL